MRRFELDGRSALVTGAGSGIGQAIALALFEAGAAVVASDIDARAGEETAALIKEAGGRAISCVADVTEPSQMADAVRIAERLGAFRVAVNNAGIAAARRPVAEIDLDDWRRVLDVDLTSVLICLQAEIPAMRSAGGGSIINIASMYGGIAIAGSAPYVAAKHGVVGLTRTAALDHAEDGIRVNAIGPGFVATPLNQERLSSERRRDLESGSPMNRMAQPEEITGVALWLAGDAATFATGGFYVVDGGFSIH